MPDLIKALASIWAFILIYKNDLLPSYYEENKAPELASEEVTRQAIEANNMEWPLIIFTSVILLHHH